MNNELEMIVKAITKKEERKKEWITSYFEIEEKITKISNIMIDAKDIIIDKFQNQYNLGGGTDEIFANKIVSYAYDKKLNSLKEEKQILKDKLKKNGYWWEVNLKKSLYKPFEFLNCQKEITEMNKNIKKIIINPKKIKKIEIEKSIEALDFFKHEVNSIDLQNQPSTSGYNPNSPKM